MGLPAHGVWHMGRDGARHLQVVPVGAGQGGVMAGREIAAPAPAFKPGTRLLREWRGNTHEVILLEDGVLYDGTHFRSLSEVARTITGARWSGPRFFGLKGREGNHAAA